jgi:hypothetical protein
LFVIKFGDLKEMGGYIVFYCNNPCFEFFLLRMNKNLTGIEVMTSLSNLSNLSTMYEYYQNTNRMTTGDVESREKNVLQHKLAGLMPYKAEEVAKIEEVEKKVMEASKLGFQVLTQKEMKMFGPINDIKHMYAKDLDKEGKSRLANYIYLKSLEMLNIYPEEFVKLVQGSNYEAMDAARQKRESGLEQEEADIEELLGNLEASEKEKNNLLAGYE